jgi:hypothetical protein
MYYFEVLEALYKNKIKYLVVGDSPLTFTEFHE